MNFRFSLACVSVLTLALLGCNTDSNTPAPAHDHGHEHGDGHQHASTLEEGVEQLETLKGQIEKAFTSGSPADADEALHSVGHLIDDDIVGIAEKSDLSADDKKAVKDAADVLMTKYGELHEAVHGKGADEVDTSVYDTVAKDIDEALHALQQLAGHEHHDGHDEGHDGHDEGHDGHDEGHDGHDEDHEDGDDHADAEGNSPQEGEAAAADDASEEGKTSSE